MGAQFWWFFDVLAVSMTIGILYAVISKGFNKVVFQLAAFIIAILAGTFGAKFLAPKVYHELFYDEILTSIQTALDPEDFSIYERISENLALSVDEEEDTPDTETLHAMYREQLREQDPDSAEHYIAVFAAVLEQRLNEVQRIHGQAGSILTDLQSTPDRLGQIVELLEAEDPLEIAGVMESVYYRQNYVELVQLAMFLIIELVMLIICCIIASMTNNLDQTMHLRRGDHALAIPVALVEAFVLLMILCVTVRLIVKLTDGEMMVFNQETIDGTILFRYIYQFQEKLMLF